MTSLKGTILGCITFLITVGIIITYFSQQDRYSLYSQEKGIFVFDRKTATLNYCDAQTCQMIRPNIPTQESEVVMAGISGLPGQSAVINGSISVSSPVMVPQQQGMMRSSMSTNQPMMMQQQPMTAMMQPAMLVQPVTVQPVAAQTTAADKQDDSDDDTKSNDATDGDSSGGDDTAASDDTTDGDSSDGNDAAASDDTTSDDTASDE